MDFALTEEQQMLQRAIRDFIKRECPPQVMKELYVRGEFPRDIFNKLAGLGVCGLTIPQEYGGAGNELMSAVMVIEELSRCDTCLGFIYILSAFYGGHNVYMIGNEEQRKAFLPRLAKGEILFSYALTEPDAGSDIGAVRCTATPSGDNFVVNGMKTFITAVDQTNVTTTLLRTSGTPPSSEGLTMFFIDSNSPGIQLRKLGKMGWGLLHTFEVAYENVIVPRARIAGGEGCLGKGWRAMFSTLETERLQLAPSAVGTAQGALDRAVAYAKERTQFGQPIGRFQAIRHMVADMLTRVNAARWLTYYAAWLAEQGKPCSLECNMAKLFASEICRTVCMSALDVMGAYGYSTEHEMERFVRDGIPFVMLGGSSQILKNQIAREGGGL